MITLQKNFLKHTMKAYFAIAIPCSRLHFEKVILSILNLHVCFLMDVL